MRKQLFHSFGLNGKGKIFCKRAITLIKYFYDHTQNMFFKKPLLYLSCLRIRTTIRFDFLHSFSLCANLCCSSTRVAWWLINKNVIFLLYRFIFAWRLFCFFIHTHAQLRILNFQDSVYQKAEVCTQTINEWRKLKRSVVLLRRQYLSCLTI